MRIRAINLLVYFGVYFGAYFLIQLFLVCTSLFAAEFGGSVSAEHRQFFSNPQYVGQKDGSNVGLTVEPEIGIILLFLSYFIGMIKKMITERILIFVS
jgi:hypothetical protein